MKIHTLKTWPEYFEAILNGTKTFEVRKNDRDFKVGDRLDLIEYDPDKKEFTGNHCHRFISYILDENPFIDLKGNVILGITGIEPKTDTSQVESNGEVIFEVLNKWVYNDVNSAGDTIHIIDACDLPKIIPEIIESLKTR